MGARRAGNVARRRRCVEGGDPSPRAARRRVARSPQAGRHGRGCPRGELRRRHRRLLAHPAGRARRRGDRARRAARAPPPSLSGRRIRARPARRNRLGGARAGRRLRRARRCRRRGRRSPRPHVRLTAGVARLGRPWLVRRTARARLRGPLRAPRELGLQHGRRGESDPSARLDVPLAARGRVRPRRRADLRRQPAASLVVGGTRGAALRRTPLHAHTRGFRCARVRARRARRCAAASCAGGARPRGGRRRRALPRRLPVDRAVYEVHARRARVPSPEREGGRPSDQGPDPHRGRVHGQPLAQPARRRASRDRASAGPRARKRGRRSEADRRRYQGRRIDVHGARRRCRCRRRACVRPLEHRDPRGLVAPRGVARCGLRDRAPARAPDGRDRHPLARLHRLGGSRSRARASAHGVRQCGAEVPPGPGGAVPQR